MEKDLLSFRDLWSNDPRYTSLSRFMRKAVKAFYEGEEQSRITRDLGAVLGQKEIAKAFSLAKKFRQERNTQRGINAVENPEE